MENKQSVKPLEWLNVMVSEPYYLSHFLAFFSYLIVRSSASLVLSPDITHLLLRREIQVFLAFLALTLIKMVREETWESFIAVALFYAKVLLLGLSLIMDYHLVLWYLLVFAWIYTFTQQPTYQGLGTASRLTPLQLEALLTEGSASRFWLVEFRASYSSDCVRASRCFSELSITYSNKSLAFGVIDLGLFPNVAEKFGISLGGIAQLPTYILFDNAAEIARFPDLDSDAKPPSPPITKKLLCKYFELDLHLLEYVNGK